MPQKNIKPLNGRPLVYWVLDAAIGCSAIERIFVATENRQIGNVVNCYGSSKIEVIERSASSVTDTAPTEIALLEFAADHDFEKVALIQATSPLLKTEHLEKGFQRLDETGADSLLSVVQQKRFIWVPGKNRFIVPYNYDLASRPRRQDFEGFLVENGAFYITCREHLLKSKCRISGNISYVEMPVDSYIEIDELFDWMVVENLMKRTFNK